MAQMRTATPLPLARVVIVGLMLLVNQLSMNVIFPFLPFMVAFFFRSLDEKALGFRVGYLGSAFYMGNLLSSIVWGMAADRFGRRSVLLIGVFSTFFCILSFGLSQSFVMALLSRTAWGALNGNIGVAKSYLSEICDDSNQAQGFAVIGFAGSVGRLLGPILGGYLAQPADKYPSTFSSNGFFGRFPFFLPCLLCACFACIAFLLGYVFLEEVYRSSGRKSSVSSIWALLRQRDVFVVVLLYGLISFADVIHQECFPLWVILPPEHGGFGFQSSHIGLVISICAPFQLISQAFIYPKLTDRFGFLKVFRACLWITAISSALLPYASFLQAVSSSKAFLWIVLISINIVIMTSRFFAFTTVFVLVNNSVDSQSRATVNGIGQSISALFRAIGPTIGGNIFAFTLTKNLPWPFNFTFVFLLVGISLICSSLISRQLSPSINYQKTRALLPTDEDQSQRTTSPRVLLDPCSSSPQHQEKKNHQVGLEATETELTRR